MHADFFLNTDKGLIKINSSEIHCIQSNGKHARVSTVRGDFDVSHSLAQLERDSLPANMFCRIHRSYIVPLNNIRSLDLEGVVIDGRRIPIEKPYRAKLLGSLNIMW
jgi:DNA-binding LytR/AlgR family response regulator